MNVMSFNIRCASANDGDQGWQYRKELVIERIRAFSPDLLGIQECRNDEQVEFLKENLPDYTFTGFERGGDHETAIEMAPIFIKQSAFIVQEMGCFWLSETPDVQGSTAWGSVFPRTVTWAKVKSELEGCSLYFFNTHFDHASAQAQVESALALRKHLARLGDRPVVLCGDFNAEKDSLPYQILVSSGPDGWRPLCDPYREVHPAPWTGEGSFHGFGALEKPPSIDWILVSDHFKSIEAGIDRTTAGERYPSDHYPLFSTVSLK